VRKRRERSGTKLSTKEKKAKKNAKLAKKAEGSSTVVPKAGKK
jgi:hypothetical protein